MIAAPFDAYRDVVRAEWIDNNQRMNMGYYVVVFDLATDEFLCWVGLDAAHRSENRVTTFCLEAHVTYHREVGAGFHEMYHAREGYLAATNELMSLHVSEVTRRGAPMAPEILARLTRIQKAHDPLPRPPQAGRAINLAAHPTAG